MQQRENYNDLYVFMMVAQTGSFTKAAEKMGVAQSGTSRTVRDLEARLGVQLLNRTTRKLSLTQAGEQLYRAAQTSFQVLDHGLTMLAHYRDTPSGTVRINASQYAIDQVLLPKLASFRLLYPEVQLELISENRFVDIISEHFDAGVRLGNEVEEGTVAVRISPDLEMAVVATPEHLRRYGFPQTPHDLLQHPCIAYQFANGSLYQWELMHQKTGQLFKHKPAGQYVVSDCYMEVAAARLGLGLAYVPLDLVAEDMERGHLIRVLKPYSQCLAGQYLYYPHRNVSSALRLVIDALKI